MAFRTEPSVSWEPAAGHSAAALADGANIVAGFNATWHNPTNIEQELAVGRRGMANIC